MAITKELEDTTPIETTVTDKKDVNLRKLKSFNIELDSGLEDALTIEEVNWNSKGQITTVSPSTYKIPAISDIPKEFNVEIYDLSDDYADLNIWMDHNHVAYNKKSMIFSDDIYKIITDL